MRSRPLEAATAGLTPGRHLAHIQVVLPTCPAAPRGALANAQPFWAAHEDRWTTSRSRSSGPDRASWQCRSRVANAGATLAFGSDWVFPARTRSWRWKRSPWTGGKAPNEAIETFGEPIAEVFLPEERIDLATAIGAFTMGTAYVNHQDDTTGSVEVGKFADLAVIDQNLFEIPSAELWKAKVELTFVEGDCVYDASQTA